MLNGGLLGLGFGIDGGELLVKRQIAEGDHVVTGLARILAYQLNVGVFVHGYSRTTCQAVTR